MGDVLAPKQLIQAHSILIVALRNTGFLFITSSIKLLPNGKICISSCVDISITSKVSLAAFLVLVSCKAKELTKVLDVSF